MLSQALFLFLPVAKIAGRLQRERALRCLPSGLFQKTQSARHGYVFLSFCSSVELSILLLITKAFRIIKALCTKKKNCSINFDRVFIWAQRTAQVTRWMIVMAWPANFIKEPHVFSPLRSHTSRPAILFFFLIFHSFIFHFLRRCTGIIQQRGVINVEYCYRQHVFTVFLFIFRWEGSRCAGNKHKRISMEVFAVWFQRNNQYNSQELWCFRSKLKSNQFFFPCGCISRRRSVSPYYLDHCFGSTVNLLCRGFWHGLS